MRRGGPRRGPPGADDRGLRAPRRATPPGLLFARAMGYAAGIEDGMKVVDLIETEPTWAALEAEAAGGTRGLPDVTWRDHVPEELRRRLLRAQRGVLPRGADRRDGASSPSSWDRKRVRGARGAQRRAPAGTSCRPARSRRTARIVALTEVMVNERITPRGFQSGTLVAREHRGHQLGLAIKLANHRQAPRGLPRPADPAHRQRRRERADERRQRRARLPRGRALRRDAEGRLSRCRSDRWTPPTRRRWPPGTRRYHAAHVFGQDHPSPWMLEEMRAEFLGDRTGERVEPFGAVRRRALRRAPGSSSCRMMDNRHLARVEVGHAPRPPRPRLRLRDARPPHRRSRVAHGRSTLNADAGLALRRARRTAWARPTPTS